MKLSHFGVKKPIPTLIVFFAIFLIGIISYCLLPVDLLPKIEPPSISLITFWAGSSPEDVEKQVTKPIENDLSIVNNLKEISSNSKEGLSLIYCKFDWKTDLTEASNEIRDRLEFVKKRLPADCSDPLLFRLNTSMAPVVMYSISAEENYDRLQDICEDQIIPYLQRVSGVGAVQIFGGRASQINVDIDREKLAILGLSFEEIQRKIAFNNCSLPAGIIQLGDTEYVIRIPGEFDSIDHIRNAVILENEHTLLRFGDIAHIDEGFKEDRRHVRVNGREALMIMVQKRSGENTLDVAEGVKRKVVEISERLPLDTKMNLIMDSSEFIHRSVDNLTKAAFWGIFFVALTTLAFLGNLRTSFIIILTIPVSLVVAFIFMLFEGWSLNIMSLSGFALAIGMVVDNAVVILENIMKKIEGGKPRTEAAMEGATEVGSAISASTLTSIVVFLPLIFLKGFVGVMFKEMAGIITITLFSSLFSALILTPLLCSKLISLKRLQKRERFDRIFAKIESFYISLLSKSLSKGKRTVFVSLGIFFSSITIYALIGSEFMPQEDIGHVIVTFEMPLGTPLDKTAHMCEKIEILGIKLAGKRNIENTYYKCGEAQEGMAVAFGGKEGPHIGQVSFKLVKQKKRKFSSKDFAALLSDECGHWQEIIKLDIDSGNPMNKKLQGGGKPISIEIVGQDLQVSQKIAEDIKKIAEHTQGTKDVSISMDFGKPEICIYINKEKAAFLGVSTQEIAQTLRTFFYGKEISKFQKEKDRSIYVRLPLEHRRTIEDLYNVLIPISDHKTVRLDNIAVIEIKQGPVSIERKNQERIIKVEFDTFKRTQGKVIADIQKQIQKTVSVPSDVFISYGGMIKEQKDAFASLFYMLLLGIVFVYLVMAAQFESFLEPFFVMFSVPFALTGVFFTLIFARNSLNVMSFLGIIMLIGIVVNNAIVLIDCINQHRKRSFSIQESIFQAAKLRLRPVLITSLTTICGMIPLVIGRGEGSEIWKPLGLAVMGGLFFSTLVTLIFVPTIYSIFEKRRELRRSHDE